MYINHQIYEYNTMCVHCIFKKWSNGLMAYREAVDFLFSSFQSKKNGEWKKFCDSADVGVAYDIDVCHGNQYCLLPAYSSGQITFFAVFIFNWAVIECHAHIFLFRRL